jgi:EAL domain-containing protein (putative c-di-GMP-specific phosphodiesterase class I)/ActR/RegA family two-component response regulator
MMSAPDEKAATRVLIVDDNLQLLHVYARMLAGSAYTVDLRSDGEEADRVLQERPYDVVLCDIDMPRVDGLELLRRVRERDPDMPVVLITGCPSIASAAKAVDGGATRYLQKPLGRQQLREATDMAAKQHEVARARRAALERAVHHAPAANEAHLAASFDRALASLHVAFQPIVSWSRKEVFGYEALLRSRESALPHPPAVLDAAEKLGRVHDLGRRVRALAVQEMTAAHPAALLFLNLHPLDLLDDELLRDDSPLAPHAERIVLEITERVSLHSVKDLGGRLAMLRARGFQIAVDDLGAGYAGLATFAEVEPEITKLDMSLVRGVHEQPTKLVLVRSLFTMCSDLGVLVVAEGIESAGERDALAEVGCDLMQGYHFAKPGPAFPLPRFG